MDAANGKPVKATIHYCPARDNPHVKDCPDAPFLDDRLPYGTVFQTDRDGRFRAAVLPGRGPPRRAGPRARFPENPAARPGSGRLEFLHLRNTSYLERFIARVPADRPARGQGPGHPGYPTGTRAGPSTSASTDADGRPVAGARVVQPPARLDRHAIASPAGRRAGFQPRQPRPRGGDLFVPGGNARSAGWSSSRATSPIPSGSSCSRPAR